MNNLREHLPAFLSQSYNNADGQPMYEVIVVNDASTDESAEVLRQFQLEYGHLHHISLSERTALDLKGKKYALAAGVARANNEFLLLTDADCAPASGQWVELMTQPLSAGKEIVAGYGAYHRTTGLLNKFIRWETLHTFLQYATYTGAGKPYMAVGRNMACRKSTFRKAMTHPAWNALPSGDDDLLIAIAGNESNVAIVADRRAFTWSTSKTTWMDWVHQKQRHLSTGKYYKTQSKMLLGVYGMSHAAVWLTFISLAAFSYSPAIAVVMLCGRLLHWTVLVATARKTSERMPWIMYPVFDIGWMVYNFAFLPYIGWKNKQTWK